MTDTIRKALDRIKETIQQIESLDSSYWNKSLGTSHLNAFADQLVNGTKTAASHLKSFCK